MVVFKIPKDQNRYSYPEDCAEIPFSKFLAYLELVSRIEPEPLRVLKTIEDEAEEILQDIRDVLGWDEKSSLTLTAARCRAIFSGAIKGTAKARKLLPALYERLKPFEEQRQEAEASFLDDVRYSEILAFYARIVAFATGAPYDRIVGEDGEGMRPDHLTALYRLIARAYETPPAERFFTSFTFKEIRYYLPERFMERSSVIEFAEAAQFQAQASKIRSGAWEALVDICAILCRPAGVPYSEEGYRSRRELFVDLPLEIMWQTGFFLRRQSASLGKDFLIYTLGQIPEQRAQGSTPLPINTVGT